MKISKKKNKFKRDEDKDDEIQKKMRKKLFAQNSKSTRAPKLKY